nr:TIM-barrel domain-containing protein [uncultured Draconibacterium sp.]
MKTTLTFLLLLTFTLEINAQEQPKPAITPYWAFGHWVWEDQIHTSNTVRYLIDGYSKYNIPVNAVILDSPWPSAYNNFEPDSTRYPDFEDLIDELHNKNIKLLLWYTGFVNKESREVPINQSPLFEPALRNNFTVNNGQLAQWHKGKGAHIDLTNPVAKNWWHNQVDKVLKLDIDGWKVDISAEWLGDYVSTSIGGLSNKAFRRFHYQDAFEYARSQNPDFLCYTYGHIYIRAYNIDGEFDMAHPEYSHAQWSGDFDGDFKGLNNQLMAIYKTALSGYGAPACEISGYWGNPSDKKSFIRYTQLASMVPTMVNGGNNGALGYHLPWNYDQQTINIYKDYVLLHKKFAPYLFSTSVDGHIKGQSILKNASYENKTHQLGDAILVKPITSENDSVTIVFPNRNRWINYWDVKETFASNTIITKHYPIKKYPIFIKEGAIIPVDNNENKTVEFMIFPKGESKYIFHQPIGQGVEYLDINVSVNTKNGLIEITSKEENKFKLQLICFHEPKSITGADNYFYDAENSQLTIEKTGNSFKIYISELKGY